MVALKKRKKTDQVDFSTGVEAGGAGAGGAPRDKHASRTSSTAVSNGVGHREELDPTDMSYSSDSEPDNELNGGECEKCTNPHDGKLIMQQQFEVGIDQMFTMIFTNCTFNVELRNGRGISNYAQTPWQTQDGIKCRQIKYTLALTATIGPSETQVTETQVMNKCSKPGALYSIDCTSDNAGIPYADYFSVCVHYCLQRVTASTTTLSLYGHIKYRKNTMFKSFIEKNSINGLVEFSQLLESRINADAAETAAPAARRARGRGRRHADTGHSASHKEPVPPPAPARAPPPSTAPRWLLTTMLVLLAVNALLYWNLPYGERTADLNDLQNRLNLMQSTQAAELSILLERHSARQRDEQARWREALHTTVQHLLQTEQTLSKLLQSIKPSLERAQREAEAHTRSREL